MMPIGLVGLAGLCLAIWTIDHGYLFDSFIYLVLEIGAGLFLIWTLYNDWKTSERNYIDRPWLPSLTGFLFSIAILATIFILSGRDNTRSLLSFTTGQDLNSVSIDFRTDGTYKLGSYSKRASTILRGKYTMNDSLITLDKNRIGKIILSSHLLIRPFDSDTTMVRSLFQVSETGQILDSAPVFYLLFDHRSSFSLGN
jgi:hypothetical protein